MRIRKFQPIDLDSVVQLFYDVVHTTGAKYYSQDELDAWAPKTRHDQKEWLKSLSENITFVIEEHGKIIAFGDMTKTGYIDRLYVQDKYQKQGIASALLKKFEEEALKLGLSELTTEANMIFKPLAEHQGFVVVSEIRKMRKGVEFSNYILSKKLLTSL